MGIDAVDFYIYADDVEVLHINVGEFVSYWADYNVGNAIIVTKKDDATPCYAVMINIPIQFRRKLEVKATNSASTSGYVGAIIIANLIS